MARLPYLNQDSVAKDFREHLGNMRQPDGRLMNLHRMMAYRPRQLQLRAAFSSSLNHEGVVAPRLRELAQLTVGRVTRGVYEFHHHIERGLKAGLTKEHIMALPVWERHPIYTTEERAVMRYAEEMTRDVQVKDSTFDALRGFLSNEQIVELTLVIAHYNSTARFLEALQVMPDEEGGT